MPIEPQHLARDVGACDSVDTVGGLVGAVVAGYGLTAYAGGMVTGPIAHSNRPFYFVNWPESWNRLYAERGYLRKDPAPRWAIVSGAPIAWSELVKSLPRTDPGHEVYAAAAEMGYREGIVVPVRTLSGALGVVSAGGDRGQLEADEMAELQAFFTAALLRAEALSGSILPTPSVLSLRERECASLLVQGLTDAQIAEALGISMATVRFHLDNARAKLGARSRTHLAAMIAGLPGHPG